MEKALKFSKADMTVIHAGLKAQCKILERKVRDPNILEGTLPFLQSALDHANRVQTRVMLDLNTWDMPEVAPKK